MGQPFREVACVFHELRTDVIAVVVVAEEGVPAQFARVSRRVVESCPTSLIRLGTTT